MKGMLQFKKSLAASAEKMSTVESELTVATKDLNSDVTTKMPAPGLAVESRIMLVNKVPTPGPM
eukprot:14786119-Heterocapsa_arctica.AAC.1